MIHFDLMSEIVEGEEGLSVRLTYNTNQFDAETIARLLTHYEALLQSVVADPERRVLDIPVLLTGAESRSDLPSNLHHTYEQDHFAFGLD
jgi:non-ribosomal peptide synthetase component F